MKLKITQLLILIFIISSCQKNKKLNYIDLEDNITQKIVNENALIYFNKGENYLAESKFDSAIINYKKSLNFEKNTLTYNQIGVCEDFKKNTDKAIEYYKLGIQADTTYYTNYLNVAKCYISKKELTTAEKYLIKVIENNSSKYSVTLANLHLTVVYFNQNRDCSEIIKQFKKVEILKNDNKMSDFYQFCANKVKKHCR